MSRAEMAETETPQDGAPGAPRASRRARPRRAPGRRRRFGLVALLAVTVMVGGAVMTVLSLSGRPVTAPGWLHARVEARAEAALPGFDLRFDRLDMVVEDIWRPGVRAAGVEVWSPQGLRITRIEDIRATLALEPLLRGRLHPGEIQVSGVSLKLRRAPDGSLDLAFDLGAEGLSEAPDLPGLIEQLDAVFMRPELANLSAVEADAVTLRYEDARAGRAWTVDGGRLRLSHDGRMLGLSADMVLLSGGAEAAVLRASYDSPVGQTAASLAVAFEDMPAGDLATQSSALAWLGALRAPISGALRAGLDEDGAVLPLSATLQIGEGAVQPTPGTRPVAFRSARAYMTFDPARSTLRFDELSVDSDWIAGRAEGTAQLVSPRGEAEALIGQFTLAEVTVNPDDIYDDPVTLSSPALDFRLVPQPFRLDLGQLALERGKDRAILSGQVTALEDGWQSRLDLRADGFEGGTLLALWPAGRGEGARRWLAENMSGGRFTDLTAALRSAPGTAPVLHMATGFRDAALRVVRTWPEVTDSAGRIELAGGRLVVLTERGTMTAPDGGAVDMAGTSFVVPDISVKGGPAEVGLVARGTVTAALSLLDQPPLRLMEKAGRPIDLASGRAVVRGRLDFPLRRKPGPGALRFDLTGTLSGVASDTIVPGRRLAARRLTLSATNSGVEIAGNVTLDGVQAQGSWTQPLAIGKVLPGAVSARFDLTPRTLDTFDIALPPGTVSGTAEADLAMVLRKGAPPAFSLTSALAGAALSVPPLRWSKPAGTSAGLRIEGKMTRPATVDLIALDAPGLSAAGSLVLRDGGGLESARFDSLRVGDWFDGQVRLTGRGRGVPPAVEVLGGRFALQQMPPAPSGAGTAAGEVPLNVVLNEVRISDGIALTDMRGQFRRKSTLTGTFSGRVNGGAAITGQLRGGPGNAVIELSASRAGEVLRSAGLLKKAVGGVLTLTLRPRTDLGRGIYDGTLRITETRLQDTPALAQILDAVSVIGILDQLNGPGILFTEVDGTFRMTPSEVIVTRSSAIGPSLGVAMDGIYRMSDGTMDMQGTVSPIYLLNAIGSVLTRKGEGLFAITFRLRGTADRPQVRVNPLSALTPGLFREMFRRPPPRLSN